jgi:nitrite reductase (NADH) large subunit
MNTTYLEAAITKVDEKKQSLLLENGKTIKYDFLLIATGSSPIKPSINGIQNKNIYNMWTLDDIKKIEPHFNKDKRVLVIGAAFVSLQAAWAAVQRELDVTIFVRSKIMRRVLDDKASNILKKKMLEYGAKFITGTKIEKIERNTGGSLNVLTSNNKVYEFDFIIVGTGVRANMEIVKNSTINLDKGILVDEKMRTSVKNIFAAGDVAQGPTIFGEEHVVHALWPTAVEQGKIAGANMAGKEIAYQGSLNMNVTQLFGITVASIGNFQDEDGDRVYKYESKKGYIKVVLKNMIPVGGLIVGDSELVNNLGLLRPMIRQKKKLDDSSQNILKLIRLNSYKHFR